jgi:hypothetical protein
MLQVAREDLIPGKLYYIECLTEADDHYLIPNITLPIMVGFFKGFKPVYPLEGATWNSVVFDWFEISKMKYIKDERDAHKHIILQVELNFLWRFYEVKKFKIQCDMEERALNLFLKNIIGDPYFTIC